MNKLRNWIKCYFTDKETGAIDIGSIMLMGIGMVFLAVGFIIFPIVTEATDDLLAYTFTANVAIAAATFTGFIAVVGITPLLVLIGFVSASVFSMYLGVKITKEGAGGTNLNLGNLLLLGISMIFIAIALIILPVAIDGISTVIHGGGEGINAAYTGLEPILLVTPLLILISFLAASVISGYFGIKKIGSTAS